MSRTEKLAHRNVEGFANLFNVYDGDVTLTVFYTCNVCAVKVSQMSELFLRDTFCVAKLANAVTDFYTNVHTAKVPLCWK